MPAPDFRGVFREDAVARAVYAEAAGIARILPAAVAVPADADDVATLARWAHASGTTLIARGSGSSMAGGALGPGVIVDLSRLDSIGPVDARRRSVWTAPGAIRSLVDARAREHGLRFPVDPSSGAFCTMGGMAATNAAGARTLKYGATRAWVSTLDCVFADGTRHVVRRGDSIDSATHIPAIQRFVDGAMPAVLSAAANIQHPGVRKESSGYAIAEFARTGDLVDLLIGSEGTLALFVGLELLLAPVAGATSSLLAAFPSLEAAVDGALRARSSGASACELLDRTFLDVAMLGTTNASALPANTEAVLLAEVEGADGASAAHNAHALAASFREAGVTHVTLALDSVQELALWELRHAASPILSRLHANLASLQFIEDGAVPPARLPEYVRGVRAALARQEIRGVIFGHAGDAHVHVNPLVDVSAPDWRRRVQSVLEEVTDLTARLGGTLTGEHGDGRLRTPLLGRVWTHEAIQLFALVKNAFDPTGTLNPGVKIPFAGQKSLEDIKYDPSLAPLPAPARRALDRVANERLYASCRLDLIERD